MTRHALRGAVGLAAAAALALGASPAHADAAQATKLQRQVDQVLRHGAPGARQVGANRMRWPRDGVTLTLSVQRTAHTARFSDCKRGFVCLWQDGNGTSRRVQFYRYGTYALARYGMPARTHRGASSYFNNQTGGASAYVRGWRDRPSNIFTFWLIGHGNFFALNDRASSLTLNHPSR